MKPNFNEIDVVVLCGGKGIRLLPAVSDRPKALAAIGDTTFLDILINSLKNYGFEKFILCVGYMKNQIKEHFQHRDDISIVFSEEEEPLGTGGALKNAQSLIRSVTFMVLNGDSLCDIDFHEFYSFHKNTDAILSMALVQTQETIDFGSVMVNESNEIISFKEKVTAQNPSLINAGVYLMQKEIFAYMPDIPNFSLENDFFPDLVGNRFAGFITNCELIDIGTPERYEKACHLIGGHT